jgi:hypothetical protein
MAFDSLGIMSEISLYVIFGLVGIPVLVFIVRNYKDIEFIDSSKGQSSTRPPIPYAVRRRVLLRDGGRCQHCGSYKDPQIDHIIPWSRGGTHDASNLQVLCGPCNRRKGNRYVG